MKKQKKHIGPWEMMFRALRVFHRTHRHCDVPPSNRSDGLYLWLKKQRQRYAAHELPNKQQQKLKSINALQVLSGAMELYNALWEEQFDKLKRFKKRFGHCNVPRNWQEDEKFGSWISTQRSERKRGSLKPERAQRLEKIGLAWSLTQGADHKMIATGSHYQAHEKSWNTNLKRLIKWKHNGFAVPREVDEPLRVWTVTQRNYYHKGKLRPDRQRRLEKIGFTWEHRTALDVKWDSMFQRLLAYKKKFGHANVPARWKGDLKLAHWVVIQRGFYRDNRLSRGRIEQLEKIGFSWLSHPDRVAMRLAGTHYEEHEGLWEERFAALRKWRHKKFAFTSQDDYTLYRWMLRQRVVYRAGLMRADRQQRLEKIGFTMEAPELKAGQWETKFKQIVAFKKRSGHFNVSTTENGELNAWVYRQRERRRLGKLNPDRVRRLEAIGFTWDHELDQTWERLFAELCTWRDKGFKVPVKVQPLQAWGNHQRRVYRAGRLHPERYKRLKKIGFPFEV